ncbi:hypothetical protein HNO88_004232 [Novosphingobium chloroacetimidivorans]|uniref:Uncharacterized protein n=1 Tax=Novosphingobium chloroacetimidivorans TaxID=1428314 RepID=A0A7W7NXY9_9SPHN|nr:hypothetical protein [Novosphingobium chloroacetimidivorans]MBB4860886.1 hypothetical protein [Novosphingobium chloroacetimidivorans]
MRAPHDLSDLTWTSELAEQLERCARAVGSLDARVSVSSAAHAWRERASWTGYAAALQGQGAELDEIDIFARSCGIVVPGRPLPPSHYDDPDDLPRWLAQLRDPAAWHWRDSAGFSTATPDTWNKRPALLRALEILARHARADGSTEPWLTFPKLLRSMTITASCLPCLVPVDQALRMPVREPEVLASRYFRKLTDAAVVGLERLDAMEAHRLRTAAVLHAARRPGHLATLFALVQHRPVISPLSAASHLGVTISGAGKLLARAAEAGLLVEFTGRQAWRAYIVTDLAHAFGLRRRLPGRPKAPPRPDAALEPTLAEFDAEMARIDALLARRSGSTLPGLGLARQ